ncbi:hypothetical protein QQP08_026587 [Theobroma cacao]|uniref:Uncharacterized protein n=1 Tax=Theobroma cacao TaxID=3641 RepID=A0A061GSE4_THECC|nr:Uncharacterized protein TCM_037392 [Theobroma cacao]WRX34100.1 hypothetical protein QQP08_026587 [Theobroma cacao]
MGHAMAMFLLPMSLPQPTLISTQFYEYERILKEFTFAIQHWGSEISILMKTPQFLSYHWTFSHRSVLPPPEKIFDSSS